MHILVHRYYSKNALLPLWIHDLCHHSFLALATIWGRRGSPRIHQQVHISLLRFHCYVYRALSYFNASDKLIKILFNRTSSKQSVTWYWMHEIAQNSSCLNWSIAMIITSSFFDKGKGVNAWCNLKPGYEHILLLDLQTK